MKIALLGHGRTGQHVHEAAPNDTIVDFDQASPPTIEALQQCDVAISFLPGPAFLEHLETIVAAHIPLVNGSTGYTYPSELDKRLRTNGIAWVSATNFSIGMQLVHRAITGLSATPQLLPNAQTTLHEIHHIHKKDTPSGTALTWQDWFGSPVTITSEKIGETIGEHKLTIETPYETISLSHSAKNRMLFAEGAVLAAHHIHELSPGLHTFEEVLAYVNQ